MVKKVIGIYIDEEKKEQAQVKAATELKIFKFSHLVEKLIDDFLKVGDKEEP